MSSHPYWSLACLLAALATAVPARAEPAATLAGAEKAYAEVDFERTLELALAALRHGGNEPEQTKRLYLLLGISAAALENEDEARSAFRHVLALDPATRLDQSLSPKMRAPYLEARGALTTGGEALPLEVRFEREGETWTILLRDPAAVTHSLELELEFEADGTDTMRKLHFPAEPRTELSEQEPLPARFSYTLGARDEYENWLVRVKSRVTPPPAPADGTQASLSDRPLVRDTPSRAPYFVTAGVLATLGIGAVSAGVIMQLRRDDAAEEWNSPSCEVQGQTRGEQCADVDERRRSAEHWAIGLYATGGALLVGSLVTLALTPGARRERPSYAALPCVPSFGPGGQLGAACRASF